MGKITKKTVDEAAPNGARYFIWDSTLPGFGLIVQPSGVKSFCFQYRTAEGKNRRGALGKYGVITPDEARRKAKQLQAKVFAGGDPLGEKRARKNALTVEDLCSLYLDSQKFAAKAETTQNTDRGRINRHILPLIGSEIADKLKTEDIKRAYEAIKQGKTAKTVKTGPRGLARVKGGEGAARMAIRLLKAIYSWATEQQLIAVNIAAGVKIGKDGKRNKTLTQAEYAALFDAVQVLENTYQIRPEVADAIRVIALTGARRGEIAGLRWRHVDLKKGVLVLQNLEHKTGRKTGESREIGLPSAARAIISRQTTSGPDEFVFPPAHGDRPLNLAKPWRQIREQAGLDTEVVIHTLRHSLATAMADGGATAPEIMAVLGHKNLQTSQNYIHAAQERKPQLAEKAAAAITGILQKTPKATVAKIRE